MDTQRLDRRDFLAGAGATAWLLGSSAFAHARREGEQLVPFTDPVAAPPKPGFNLQRWEDLDSWITPNDKFFRVSHYEEPPDQRDRLEARALVDRSHLGGCERHDSTADLDPDGAVVCPLEGALHQLAVPQLDHVAETSGTEMDDTRSSAGLTSR